MSGGGYSKGTAFSKLVRINSTAKHPGETNSNFTINLGNQLQQVTQVSISSCQFWNVNPNFYSNSQHSNNNVSIIYDLNLGAPSPHTITIFWPPGFYTAEDFLVSFNTAIQALGMTGIAWVLGVNNKYSITNLNANQSLTIEDPRQFNLFSGQTLLDEDPFEMLGVQWSTTNQSYLIPSGGTYFALQNQPYMVHTSLAYIASAALSPSNSFDEEGKVSNILTPINITAPWGQLNVFECRVDQLCELFYHRPRALNQIDIQLLDHEGYLIDLDQTELNIELRIWYNNN